MIQQTGLKFTKVAENFGYEKNNNGYWYEVKLHKQIVEKALPIAKAVYLRYLLCFLFDNTTSHSVYVKDAL